MLHLKHTLLLAALLAGPNSALCTLPSALCTAQTQAPDSAPIAEPDSTLTPEPDSALCTLNSALCTASPALHSELTALDLGLCERPARALTPEPGSALCNASPARTSALCTPSPSDLELCERPARTLTARPDSELCTLPSALCTASPALPSALITPALPPTARGTLPSIYGLPYSLTGRVKDWHRLWINTAVLSGAFVGTLLVLECLPEDATTWNRAEIRDVPLFKRWYNHVFVKGPEWDHDKFIFNYVLHPYAGAVYFMSARSCGFNFWQSLLYSAIISDVGWEFGIEAFMERPSYQDMVVTPVVGSIIGEGFYRLKRYIVDHDYRLFGSPVVGNVVAFIIDPVNELVGFFDHNPARAEARRRREARGETINFAPTVAPGYGGFTLTATF